MKAGTYHKLGTVSYNSASASNGDGDLGRAGSSGDCSERDESERGRGGLEVMHYMFYDFRAVANRNVDTKRTVLQ